MHFYISISLFSIIIILYWVISEVITIVFRFTGLPDEKARFQVVSLLTGCGFTTRESEMVLSTKERRHIARITMLFGYVFNITIVSILINIILSLKESQAEHYLHAWLIPLVPAVLLLIRKRVDDANRYELCRLPLRRITVPLCCRNILSALPVPTGPDVLISLSIDSTDELDAVLYPHAAEINYLTAAALTDVR